MPTNRVTKGKSLEFVQLQPGWSIENDGFGLLTCSAHYVGSHGNDAGTTAGDGKKGLELAPMRGQAFTKDGRLFCHRASSSMNSNGMAVITAEYVGIEDGNMTRPQVTGHGSMSTEPIATHPKFETFAGTVASPLNGAVFRADGSFDKFGEHTGGRDKYGVKSYLNPGFVINGFFYCSSIGVAASLKGAMGQSSDTGFFNNINLLGDLSGIGPSWNGVGNFQAPNESPQLLLTGINLEFYGILVKVGYEITFATQGWDVDLYPYVNGNYKKGGGKGNNSAGKSSNSLHSELKGWGWSGKLNGWGWSGQ